MIRLKKIFTLLTVVMMLICLLSISAFAASDFSDMPAEGYWSTQALKAAVGNGLLGGYDGQLMPKDNLTRAQMAAIISRAFGATEKADISAYTDVLENAWYSSDIATAVQMKLFMGSSATTMEPEKAITRQEAFAVLARALKLPAGSASQLGEFSDSSSIETWAAEPISALLKAEYIHGSDGRLRPTDTITREEFAQVMYNVLGTYCSSAGTYTEVERGNVMVNTDGVTLQNLTISGDLIIGEGVGNGNIYLDSVTITGRVVVRSGGENSIHVQNNSSVGSIIIAKTDSGNVRIVAEDGCSVEIVVIDDGKDDVILEGGFDSVSVTSDTHIVLREADIEDLTMTAQNSSVTLESGSITSAQIGAGATGSNLEVAKGATVTKIESAAANANITGSGTVKEALISGDNTTISTQNTALAVAAGTSGVTENGNAVAGGAETTTGSGASLGGNSGGSSPSYYTASVSTVAELESALSATHAKAIRITDSFTLSGGEESTKFVLHKPVTVVSGATLTVGGNMNLCVENTLTNNGTIVLEGEMESAQVDESYTGTIYPNNGQMVVSDGGIVINNDTITIEGASCSSIRQELLLDENGDPVLDDDNNPVYINVQGPNGGLFCVKGGTINNYGTITAEQGDMTADPDDGDNRYWGGYLEVGNAGTLNNDSNATVNFSGAILYIWAEEDEALFLNSGILNVTDGIVQIGDGGTLEVTSTGSLVNSSDAFCIGEYEYDDETKTEYITVATFLVCGSVTNSGTINISQPGSNALVILDTGSVTNNGTITNNGRINVMGALDTEGGTITNNGHFFVQYTEDVADIIGKANISGTNPLQFLAFDETDLSMAMTLGYTDIIISDEIVLSQSMIIPNGTKLTIDEGCSLQVPLTLELTNNGSIYLALCELAADEADQLQAELCIEGILNNTDTGDIQIAAVYDESENYSGGESVLWVTSDGVVTNSGSITNYGRITNIGSFTTTGTVTNAGHFFNLGSITGIISGEAVIVPEE